MTIYKCEIVTTIGKYSNWDESAFEVHYSLSRDNQQGSSIWYLLEDSSVCRRSGLGTRCSHDVNGNAASTHRCTGPCAIQTDGDTLLHANCRLPLSYRRYHSKNAVSKHANAHQLVQSKTYYPYERYTLELTGVYWLVAKETVLFIAVLLSAKNESRASSKNTEIRGSDDTFIHTG